MSFTLLFIRLLAAHLLGDFFLQPTKWVEHKKRKSFRSPYQYLHALIHAVLAYVIVAEWHMLWIPFWVFVSHLCIDLIKSRFPNHVWSFILDQMAHLGVLAILTLIFIESPQSFASYWGEILQNDKMWWVIIGYLFITKPIGFIIQFFTQKWQDELKEKANEESLTDAGKWIGYLERILTLTFILIGEFSAIGFLIAAKSIFRFGDLTNSKERKMTEYILIGTLLSFTMVILIGILIKYGLE
jgi:hypothetical protein